MVKAGEAIFGNCVCQTLVEAFSVVFQVVQEVPIAAVLKD